MPTIAEVLRRLGINVESEAEVEAEQEDQATGAGDFNTDEMVARITGDVLAGLNADAQQREADAGDAEDSEPEAEAEEPEPVQAASDARRSNAQPTGDEDVSDFESRNGGIGQSFL